MDEAVKNVQLTTKKLQETMQEILVKEMKIDMMLQDLQKKSHEFSQLQKSVADLSSNTTIVISRLEHKISLIISISGAILTLAVGYLSQLMG